MSGIIPRAQRVAPNVPGRPTVGPGLARRIAPNAVVAIAAVLIGLLLAIGRSTSTSIGLAAGVAVIPILIYVAADFPAAAAGLLVASQLFDPQQIQSPVGTITVGHVLLALLLIFHLPLLIQAYRASHAVRVGTMLLGLWLVTFLLRFSYDTPSHVLRDGITNAGFVAVAAVGVAFARLPGVVRNIAVGAAFALLVLGVCGMLASMGLIPHPTRQWNPDVGRRALIGIPTPFIRNYGLNLVFDSVATMLPLCLPYLLWVLGKRGSPRRPVAGAALFGILVAIIFVFQSRDMLVQVFVALAAFLMILRPRLGLVLIVVTVPYAVYAVGQLEAVDQTSSTLRKADIQFVLATATRRPQAYLFGSDEEQVARNAAASVGLAAALQNQKNTNIHSFFLENLVAGGWLAFLLLVGFYAYAAMCALRAFRAQPTSVSAIIILVAMPQMLFTITLEPVAAQIIGSWLLAGLAIGRADFIPDKDPAAEVTGAASDLRDTAKFGGRHNPALRGPAQTGRA